MNTIHDTIRDLSTYGKGYPASQALHAALTTVVGPPPQPESEASTRVLVGCLRGGSTTTNTSRNSVDVPNKHLPGVVAHLLADPAVTELKVGGVLIQGHGLPKYAPKYAF